VRDIAFDHKQPDPAPHAAQYAPIAYPHALLIRADDVLVSNVFFLRPARAIAIHSPTAVGRVVLDRIWGWPLLEGIRIDTAQDTVKVRNVHFWPFWSPPDPANPTRRPVEEYVAQKGEAIVSERNDNPHFSDIFCLGYKYGFHFSQSTAGKTSKFRIANADLDHCKVGLQVSGNGVTGQLVNFTTQGWRPSDSVCGIRVEGDDASIQATNVRITSFGCNGIRVEGKSAPSLLLVDNLIVDKWDLTQRKFPAVEGFGRGQVKLGRMFIATGGGLPDSPATGGDVTRA
jgi:hypothetical protein